MITEKIQQNFPLADLSTFKIGGAAEFFIAVKTKAELTEAIEWAHGNSKAITVLGGGSNILINDNGVKGIVIKLDNDDASVDGLKITSGARCDVGAISRLALEHGLAGIEWSIGIPGSMGGAIRGNAGAHGISFDTVVENVIAFDSRTLEFKNYAKEQCAFKYRHSLFKDNPLLIVWEISLILQTGDKETMAAAMKEYKDYRLSSQPKEPSAGCIFKNFFAADIEKINSDLFKLAETDHKIRGGKIGAGYLIEKLGLMGTARGGAKISEQHANFIVNVDQARASDVVALIKQTKQRVHDGYGVELEEEVQYVGFND